MQLLCRVMGHKWVEHHCHDWKDAGVMCDRCKRFHSLLGNGDQANHSSCTGGRLMSAGSALTKMIVEPVHIDTNLDKLDCEPSAVYGAADNGVIAEGEASSADERVAR
jgi:hypothetical protein